MCERLANAARELLVAHQRLYQEPGAEKSNIHYHTAEVKVSHPNKQSVKSRASSTQSSGQDSMSPINSMGKSEAPPLSALLGPTTSDDSNMISSYPQQQQQQQGSPYKTNSYYMPSPPTANATTNGQPSIYDQQQQQRQNTALSSTYSNWNRGNEIDFNSLEFLYDTGLFGQVVFDVNNNPAATSATTASAYPQQHPLYQNLMSAQTSQPFISTSVPINSSSPTMSTTITMSTTTTSASAFQPVIQQQQIQQQQQQQQQQNSSPNTFPPTPSKSLWN